MINENYFSNGEELNVMEEQGAFVTGQYPNVFEEIGVSKDEVVEKIRKKTSSMKWIPIPPAWWIPETSMPGQKA